MRRILSGRTFSLRSLLLTITCLCLLLAGVLSLVPHSVTLESTHGVVAGMTRDDVLTQLGRPDGTMMVYGSKKEFGNYRVGVLGQKVFTVKFDPEGRVQATQVAEVWRWH